jgi:hypothetical protein
MGAILLPIDLRVFGFGGSLFLLHGVFMSGSELTVRFRAEGSLPLERTNDLMGCGMPKEFSIAVSTSVLEVWADIHGEAQPCRVDFFELDRQGGCHP